MMVQDIGIVDTKKIISVIKDIHNFDLSNFALTTFKRRVLRIIQVFNFQNVTVLISKLEEDKSFFEKFLDELLIEHTELFRDPSLWRILRDVYIPELRRNRDVKVWFPITTSGDEVHTFTIVLKELGLLDEFRILVTGFSERILNQVKAGGQYDLKKIEASEANYKRYSDRFELSDYFTSSNSKAVFGSELLKNTEFKVIDSVETEPPGGFKLVICRNQLLYFNQSLHEIVVKNLAESLIGSGYLVLGSKENMEGCSASSRFILINREEKIYKKKA